MNEGGIGDYMASGLRFRSPLILPFRPGVATGTPDVTVRFGAVPKTLSKPIGKKLIWETASDTCLMAFEGMAR